MNTPNVDLGAVGAATKEFSYGPEDHGASVADLELLEHTPGIDFELMRFEAYMRTSTNAVTVDLKKNGVSVLAAPIALVDATAVKGLFATAALRNGDADDVITVHVTTIAAGAAGGLVISGSYRLVEI